MNVFGCGYCVDLESDFYLSSVFFFNNKKKTFAKNVTLALFTKITNAHALKIQTEISFAHSLNGNQQKKKMKISCIMNRFIQISRSGTPWLTEIKIEIRDCVMINVYITSYQRDLKYISYLFLAVLKKYMYLPYCFTIKSFPPNILVVFFLQRLHLLIQI